MIFGLVECVSVFSCVDLLNFVVEYYLLDWMILFVVGVVDYDDIVCCVEVLFGDLCQVLKLVFVVVVQFVGGEICKIKLLEQVYFVFVFEGLDYWGQEIYFVQIFVILLGGGMLLWLFQEVCEKCGLCYLIFVQVGVYFDIGMMMIYVGISGVDIVELLIVIIDEFKCCVDDLIEVEVVCVWV